MLLGQVPFLTRYARIDRFKSKLTVVILIESNRRIVASRNVNDQYNILYCRIRQVSPQYVSPIRSSSSRRYVLRGSIRAMLIRIFITLDNNQVHSLHRYVKRSAFINECRNTYKIFISNRKTRRKLTVKIFMHSIFWSCRIRYVERA